MRKVYVITFVIGLFLLSINIIGLFIPLRNSDIYQERNNGFQNDITLHSKEAFELIENAKRDNPKKYVQEINDIFNKAIAHYWQNDGNGKYNLTIPIYENYILFILHFVFPAIYEKYEYCNYEKAIERGIGLCSQEAIAITDFLNKNRIETKVVGLEGHVVVTSKVDDKANEWWILDPDFGVVIPYSLTEIEKNPEIAEQYYKTKFGPGSDSLSKQMSGIYGSEGNVIYSSAIIGNVGYIDCNWKKVVIEKLSGYLKWVIPLALILPLVFLFFKNK